MEIKISPIVRRSTASFLFMDINRLSENLSIILKNQSKYFKNQLNEGELGLYLADGKRIENTLPEEAINNLKECPLKAKFFQIRLLAIIKLPGPGIKLIPEEYIFISINLIKREFIFEISVLSDLSANEIFKIAIDGINLILLEIPQEHRYLESFVKKLLDDHSPLERNVFLIMRYIEGVPFSDIISTIHDICSLKGLNVIRADDKAYTDDLWDNVMTYMYGSANAIAIFDQINYREFNPNVATEVGFMLAQHKRILLLKDQSIPVMPTDIIGKIYRSFDTYKPKETIPPQLEKWFNDCGF